MNRHSSSRPSSSSRRSKLYERYDVNIKSSSSRRSGRRGGGEDRRSQHQHERYHRAHEHDDYDDEDDEEDMQFERMKRRNQLLLFAVAVLLVGLVSRPSGDDLSTGYNSSEESIAMRIQENVDGDVSKKKTPNKDSNNREQQLEQRDQIMKEASFVRKRWNPCTNSKYELERHDHEDRHGDICRAKGGLVGVYECPEGCHETAGTPPFCANDDSKGVSTKGNKGGPCRVRDPNADPEYRCDYGGVCILAVGTPIEQFKGKGRYYDETCDNKCGDGRKGELTPWIMEGGRCATDFDCSLAGVCLPDEGKCMCDLWAEGADCSYLRFEPVDKSRLGYLDENHSSWGGSIVQKSDGEYHMYVSEIICNDEKSKRCGLNSWETNSRIAQATSANVDGPYRRLDSNPVVLHPEHHNPSIHISPTTGHWHLFTISGPTGPIERMISTDEGKTWGVPSTISPRQNPGPLLRDDGSIHLFYRADGLNIPYPTCSNEGISVQHCPSDNGPCNEPDDKLVFGHTGEDPSVFRDHRGYYHMLFNALPYKCVPKLHQGGQAWSLDGITWSTPRIGAFDTTIQFTDGSSMSCERRERPQMVVGKDGRPLALASAVTGCPRWLGGQTSDSFGSFYRGGADSFTLIQKMPQ